MENNDYPYPDYPLSKSTILLPEYTADIEHYTPIDFASKVVSKETEGGNIERHRTPYDNTRSMHLVNHRSYLQGLLYYMDGLKLYIEKVRPFAMLKKNYIPDTQTEYRQVIHHTPTTSFGLWERIKILFGKPVIVTSELYLLDDSVHIVGVKSVGIVPPLYQSTMRGGMELSAPLSPKEQKEGDSPTFDTQNKPPKDAKNEDLEAS